MKSDRPQSSARRCHRRHTGPRLLRRSPPARVRSLSLAFGPRRSPPETRFQSTARSWRRFRRIGRRMPRRRRGGCNGKYYQQARENRHSSRQRRYRWPESKSREYPLDAWKQVIDINLTGVFLCCRAIVPHMIRQNYGRIVKISSIAGKEGNPPPPDIAPRKLESLPSQNLSARKLLSTISR